MNVKLINYTQNPVDIIEQSASICYDSDYTKRRGKIFNQCVQSGHLSVMEHASFTFKVDGISRACSHQLVRHRTGKFTQRSQRYCNENNFEYVTPVSIKHNPEVEKAYFETIQRIKWFYVFAVRNGIKPEDARAILPNACTTQLVVTFDLRNLMHFMNERLCANAQSEIRELANQMRNEVLKFCPELKDVLVPKCQIHQDYPFCTERKCCGLSPKLEDIYSKGENTNKSI